VVGIILRRIEISIHAALRAKCKQRLALRHAPGRAKKTFHDAAAPKCLDLRHERFNVAQGCHGDKVQYPPAQCTAAMKLIQAANDRRAILPMGNH
jgi:hypothetical protein